MSKNYFTDEQVKALAKKSGIDISYLGYFHELKRLMNLAVETAIGEVVAYQYDTPTGVDGLSRIELSRNKLNAPKDTTITPLYSVQELDS